MAQTRVYQVRESKVVQTCEACQNEIPIGSPYVWYKFRTEPFRHFRCMDDYPTPSELESNKKGRLWFQARDAYEQVFETSNPEDAVQRLQWTIDKIDPAIELISETVKGWTGTNMEYSERYRNHQKALIQLQDFAAGVVDGIRRLNAYIEQDYESDSEREDWTQIITTLPGLPEIKV